MRLSRMTTRRWMIAVAMIGVALGGVEVLNRRRNFALAMAPRHSAGFYDVMYSPEAMKDFRPLAKYADYHMRMERKWRRAARYPWLPVEPDPPEPN